MTKKNEKVDLQYAAYEPKKLQSGNKNPLIIWLHGQGEGGTDPDITLLGNKVTALTKEDIQNHFKSGRVDFRNTIIIMTSNLGATQLQDELKFR